MPGTCLAVHAPRVDGTLSSFVMPGTCRAGFMPPAHERARRRAIHAPRA